jgi:23S rRNA (guanosine2251-2'-O)-methyltransferase
VAIGLDEAPSLSIEELASDASSKLVLALDEVEDPQNLGNILRTAWLQGVAGVLVPEMRSARLSPSVCRVACGGAEHVPLIRCENLPLALTDLKAAGFWIYGLAEEGQSLTWQVEVAERAVWVVGSESSGLRTTVRRACDDLVRIEQAASGSSYNAATAAALALYETTRQRSAPRRPFR